MPSFFAEKIMPFQAKDLYNMVLDIENYPEFVPWCDKAIILEKNTDNIIADLYIHFKAYKAKYTSRVTLDEDELEISVESIQGPFKHLYQGWKFTPKKESSLVEFDIDFKMKSFVIEKVISLIFSELCNKMMFAFEKRAHSLLK